MRVRQIIVAGVAIVFAAWSMRDAGLAVWLSAESAGPPAVVRGDPRVQLTALEVGFLPDGIPAANRAPGIADLARTVLRSAPLEVSALRDLALASQRLGDPAAIARLRLAERVSRRDVPTQNALLRMAAQNGQYASAIAHLDRILSVSPETESEFDDAMIALVGDPVGRRILARYDYRAWFRPFAAQAVALADDPRNVADLLLRTRMRGANADSLGSELLKRLIAAHEYPEARDFAVRFAGATSAALDDFRLNAATANPVWIPLSWRLTSNVDVTPRLANDGTVDMDIKSGVSTVIMERVTLLPPGSYDLEQEVSANDGGKFLRLQWQLSCQATAGAWAPATWRQQVPLAVQPTRYRSPVVLPADCLAQRWQLTAATDETQLPTTFRLTNLALKTS